MATIKKGDKMSNRVMMTGNELYHVECVIRNRPYGKLTPIEVDGMLIGFKCKCGVKFAIQEIDKK